MLLSLKIKDFAIIEETEVDFGSGFTVVTGETGSGKSIVVDALLIALGSRATGDVVRSGAACAVVEALFDISAHPVVRARLEARDLVGDDAAHLVVRRTVALKGRGKVSINGRMATLATLAEVVRGLVDISGQHDQQSLLDVDNHLEILDAFAEVDDLKSRYQGAFSALRDCEREIGILREGDERGLQRVDFLQFQLEEFDRLGIESGLDERSLEQERGRLANAERLEAGARGAEALLYGEDGSAFDKIGRACAELETLSRTDDGFAGWLSTLDAARRELQEVARGMLAYAERIEVDPERLGRVDDRLSELRRLARKHGCAINELAVRRDSLSAELDGLSNIEHRLGELEKIRAQHLARAMQAGEELSCARKKAGKRLGTAVSKEVEAMELTGAELIVEVETGEGDLALRSEGMDRLEFRWAPNPGEPPKSLAKIASGGELSRLMLAVKTVLAKRDLVSLYVFDEVDSGLGGRAADRIGAKIQAVAAGHQAIAITHLAPIAARADHHWVVTKATESGRTVSDIVSVAGKARLEELARMIDGASASPTTRKAAREMLARRQQG